jgi:hypothetical protein
MERVQPAPPVYIMNASGTQAATYSTEREGAHAGTTLGDTAVRHIARKTDAVVLVRLVLRLRGRFRLRILGRSLTTLGDRSAASGSYWN